MFRYIHSHEVRDLIANLTTDKSCIGVPAKCFKVAGDHIYEAMTKVYNLSIEQGIVPDILKISKVTPVDKVHYHYLIYWIYLLLQISINYSFLTSLISGILKNYQISLISIFAMQVKSIHIIRDMLQKVTSTNHVPGPI